MSTDFAVNPFGVPTDHKHLPTYTTPVAALSSVLYTNLNSIFSYKVFSEPDLLDSAIKKWAQKDSSHLFFKELDIRSGAGLTALGYSKNNQQVSGIIAPGYALNYFVNTFKHESDTKGKFLFNIGALDYNEHTGEIISDYITPLNVAAELGYPVVTPLSTNEVKATSLLSLALAKFGKSLGAINLFDGANYSKSVLKIDEKSDDEILDKLSKDLTDGASFEEILDKFNENSEQRLHNFQYTGDENAETVFVTYGSLESELFSTTLQENGSKVGLISIRIPLPFDTDKFVAQIPSTTKKLVVIGQSLDGSSPSLLKSKVSAALFFHGKRDVKISEYIYQPNFVWSPSAVEQIASSFVSGFKASTSPESENFIYWSTDNSANVDLSSRLVHALSLVDKQDVSLRTKFDNAANAGVFQAQFTASPVSSSHTVSNIDSASVSIVENISILNVFDVVSTIKKNGTVLIISEKSLAEKDLSDKKTFTEDFNIPAKFLEDVANKNIKVVFIDAETIGDREETRGRTLSFISQAVFWKYAYNHDVAESVRRIWNSAGPDIELLAAVLSDTITTAFEVGVREVPAEAYKSFIEKEEKKEEEKQEEEQPIQLSAFVSESSFAPNPRTVEEFPDVQTDKVADITKKLTFKEAYGVEEELRPDLPVKNFVVKVQENRRVTPADYDRYIFHIEFDITGTGLTYDIGEALGVHARNNEAQVKEFLKYYGLNENDIVTVPNKDDNKLLESRTVLQAFVDGLDIFGKPPKRFYESIIEFATDEAEKKKLEDLVSPAGAVELKKYQDVEYYTYADIFELFPSARPSVEDLVRIIAPLKRREYSIASSQKAHPNAVHLLIVVVDWIDNKGRKRFGQASKYLSELSVGSELVVSVKPSVMKLPPSPKQPVIMSGLGTGLAPFKAIVEEKLWQKQQGHEIGEVYLYLGSRHKREEYLYGELWEAYKDAGIITHIGAAFSRDQPQKIYIQDRIRENLNDLKVAMIDKQGSFYLCGPTWPVPDITKALQDIISADAAEKGVKVDLEAAIEELKESSRYILEVY